MAAIKRRFAKIWSKIRQKDEQEGRTNSTATSYSQYDRSSCSVHSDDAPVGHLEFLPGEGVTVFVNDIYEPWLYELGLELPRDAACYSHSPPDCPVHVYNKTRQDAFNRRLKRAWPIENAVIEKRKEHTRELQRHRSRGRVLTTVR